MVYISCHFTHRYAKLEPQLCENRQNRPVSALPCRRSNLRCCISSACRSTINCWIAKVCFRLELRANLCFQISTAGACRAKQTYWECTQFTANLCFQPCKPLGEVTFLLLGFVVSDVDAGWEPIPRQSGAKPLAGKVVPKPFATRQGQSLQRRSGKSQHRRHYRSRWTAGMLQLT